MIPCGVIANLFPASSSLVGEERDEGKLTPTGTFPLKEEGQEGYLSPSGDKGSLRAPNQTSGRFSYKAFTPFLRLRSGQALTFPLKGEGTGFSPLRRDWLEALSFCGYFSIA
jgi:hypothetical protein